VNDVEVNIYDGETLIEKAVTDFIGNVEVELPKKELTVKLTNLPKGMCELEEGYKLNGKGGNVLFQVGSSVIEEKIPSNKKFKLGDIMYDFEFTDTKGNEYSLADTLKTKDLVLINFWASWCDPCKMEFANFNLGYEFFSDRVEYFVMSIDPMDTISVIERYMKVNNINFPMGRDVNNVYDHFNNYAPDIVVPVTVLVNKYGIIKFFEVGAITSEDDFIELLEENLKF
jgi:peroxiredoxin